MLIQPSLCLMISFIKSCHEWAMSGVLKVWCTFKGVLESGSQQYLASEWLFLHLLGDQNRWHHRQFPMFKGHSEVLWLSEQQHGYHVLSSEHAHRVCRGLLQDCSWRDPWHWPLWAQEWSGGLWCGFGLWGSHEDSSRPSGARSRRQRQRSYKTRV